MDSITITKDKLYATLMYWERLAKDGQTLSVEETDKLSVDEKVTLSTNWLWEQLYD